MTEQNDTPEIDLDDTEGHLRRTDEHEDDTEGHVHEREDKDDTEGHIRQH